MAIGKVIKSDGQADPAQVMSRPRGVMNAEEVEARTQGRQIIADAEARAQAILAEARQQAQAGMVDARREGREEGFASISAELARAKMQAGEMLKASQKDIIALALIVAEKIIGRDIERSPEALIEICATAIENVRNAKQMVLRVHPENGNILRAKKKELMDLVARSVDIAIKDDPDVKAGGCIVQTEFGTIDAQLHTQLAMLQEVLVSDDAKRPPRS